LSYIVTMIRSVFYDLRIFLLFYAILCIIFSLNISIIGLNNFNRISPFSQNNDEEGDEYPGREYKVVGLLFGNI